MCLLASNQSDIILPGNESGDVRDKIFVVPRNGQQGAPSYQAKELQEDEMIEEHDAIRQQRPPHVPHRLRLVGTWKEDIYACKGKPSFSKMRQI